jgi:hypothetical protein
MTVRCFVQESEMGGASIKQLENATRLAVTAFSRTEALLVLMGALF